MKRPVFLLRVNDLCRSQVGCIVTRNPMFFPASLSVTLIRFKEQIQHNQMQVEWVMPIARVLDKHIFLSTLNIPEVS